MVNRKGISTIIATLVLLLVTLGIVSTAAMYLMGLLGGYTKAAYEITGVDCSSTGAKIYVHNIGTEKMSKYIVQVTERDVVSGNTTVCKSQTPANDTAAKNIQVDTSDGGGTIDLGSTATISDSQCTSATDAYVRYTIIVAGRVQKTDVRC
jgi:hypothetical protein